MKRRLSIKKRDPAQKTRFRIFFTLIVIYIKSVGSLFRALLGLGACYRLAQALSERVSRRPKRRA